MPELLTEMTIFGILKVRISFETGGTKMNDKEFQLMMSAAKQYYQLGISQDEIAKKAFVSKSTISRLIKRAVELGYVEFKIYDAGETVSLLQQEMFDEFGVSCIVLPSYVDEYLVQLNDVCAYAAAERACKFYWRGRSGRRYLGTYYGISGQKPENYRQRETECQNLHVGRVCDGYDCIHEIHAYY